MRDKPVPPLPPFAALVVDDEELYAQAIRRELERAGIACECAFNAREALHRCEKGRYQAILLDHTCPTTTACGSSRSCSRASTGRRSS
jgi:DNA-binding response OmpR family regulator